MTLHRTMMTARLIAILGAVSLLYATTVYAEPVQLHGMVTKIQSDVVFAKTPWGLRMIGTKKQLPDVSPGDRVTMRINEDNSVVDVHKEGTAVPTHRVINGHLIGSAPVKNEIRLWTAEGKKVLPVSTVVIPRLSAIPEGTPVTVELNERGHVIDVRKFMLLINNKT